MNKKEFYNSVILGIPAKEILDEEQIKQSVICECRIMNKADVYEWCAGNELKNKQLQQENQQLKDQLQQQEEVIQKAIEKLQQCEKVIEEAIKYLDGSYEMSIYTKSVTLEKENVDDLLDILNKYKKEESE